jgi:hypothetical protein
MARRAKLGWVVDGVVLDGARQAAAATIKVLWLRPWPYAGEMGRHANAPVLAVRPADSCKETCV